MSERTRSQSQQEVLQGVEAGAAHPRRRVPHHGLHQQLRGVQHGIQHSVAAQMPCGTPCSTHGRGGAGQQRQGRQPAGLALLLCSRCQQRLW